MFVFCFSIDLTLRVILNSCPLTVRLPGLLQHTALLQTRTVRSDLDYLIPGFLGQQYCSKQGYLEITAGMQDTHSS